MVTLKKLKSFLVFSWLTAFISFPLTSAIASQFEQGDVVIHSTVTQGDCVKCHEDIVLALEQKGKAHQTLCLDCHQGHPPADMEIIPLCSRCHQGARHFSLDGCIDCHNNPHTPLVISLTHKITDPCLTCHSEQIEQLRSNPSVHTKLACTACHNFHGQLPPCQNCHLPHSDVMEKGSCRKCHKPHMPLVVTYGQDIVPEYCGACHKEVYAVMAQNLTKHRGVFCVSCHEGKHGMIPACENCHGRPHPEEILEKFDRCGDCHGPAHKLSPTDYISNIFVKRPRAGDGEM